ncbi:MAG: FtsX-like permease family protein [Luteitalea sp.]|nr:FtsX-like permease family protein [Luteitalea sp.]
MTRHLFRLIWNRKRHNFLLTLEILCSFLVLFAVVLVSIHYVNNWRQPVGYDIDRVWSISAGLLDRAEDPEVNRSRSREAFRQLLAELEALPNVEVAAGATTAPYVTSTWTSGDRLADGRHIQHGVNWVTDDFRHTIELELVAGRWFSAEDDGVSWTPVVINQRLARMIFGNRDPIGRIIPYSRASAEERARPDYEPDLHRIIGVVEDFRQFGELATPGNFLFHRVRLDVADPQKEWLPNRLIVRVTPGTTAAFEETLLNRLRLVARDWSFQVEPLVDLRKEQLQQYLAPLIAVGIVAAFLLLMVALGLTGVVWQSVTQRTQEIGLRRAGGATIVNIQHQVLGELVIMTSLAVLAGVLLVAQIPALPLPPDVWLFSNGVFLTAIVLSAAAIYLLTVACGWYPSRLATTIQPAEALHYE